MTQWYNCEPGNLIACIGPAISAEHFEVGDEVAGFFRNLFNNDTKIVWRNPHSGRDHINLKEANRSLLLGAGLKAENIEINPLCTFSLSELFFSARRDGRECGRFATGIIII